MKQGSHVSSLPHMGVEKQGVNNCYIRIITHFWGACRIRESDYTL